MKKKIIVIIFVGLLLQTCMPGISLGETINEKDNVIENNDVNDFGSINLVAGRSHNARCFLYIGNNNKVEAGLWKTKLKVNIMLGYPDRIKGTWSAEARVNDIIFFDKVVEFNYTYKNYDQFDEEYVVTIPPGENILCQIYGKVSFTRYVWNSLNKEWDFVENVSKSDYEEAVQVTFPRAKSIEITKDRTKQLPIENFLQRYPKLYEILQRIIRI